MYSVNDNLIQTKNNKKYILSIGRMWTALFLLCVVLSHYYHNSELDGYNYQTQQKTAINIEFNFELDQS